MVTLVIGARGAVGRHVVEQLVAAGEAVRASVRDRTTAQFPPPVSVVQADLTEPDTLKAALDGAARVFLYATPEGADGFAKAALDAGVEHVVLMSSGSVLIPWTEHNLIGIEHRAVERILTDAGLHVTPIRPLVLANNALNWAGSIREQRVVRLVHPESVTAPIHERDIAAVAVAALTGTAQAPASDLLTGPRLMSQRAQIDIIADVIGAPIRIDEISEDDARARFGGAGSPEMVEAILDYIRVGLEPGGSPVTSTARAVLGRDPVPFAEWARDQAARFH